MSVFELTKLFFCAVIDGKKIRNVDRQSLYQPSNDTSEEYNSSEHDDYVLRRLLKKSGQLPHRYKYFSL